MNLTIYLHNGETVSVPIDESTTLTKKLMNEDYVNAQFTYSAGIPIGLGSYILVGGVKYTVNQLPTIVEVNKTTFKHNVFFHGKIQDLKNKAYFSSDNLLTFTYVGTAHDYLTQIVAAMNIISTGWVVGSVDASEKKLLEFANDTCYTALYKVAEAFKFEFRLTNQTIDLKSTVGTVQNITFEYGKDQGLHEIERRIIANAPHYTRVYGFGGSRNIPYWYRDRAKALIFEEKYLDKEVATFGIKEGVYINEDIFPNRTSTLTAVNMQFNGEVFDNVNSYVTDANLDFDINAFLMSGLTAKIIFKSGDLSGYEFEIHNYDHSTKRIYMNPFTDTDTFAVPNLTNKAKIGDEYTLVDIDMPPNYIIAAESALKSATQKYLDDNCVPKTMYIVKFDPKFIKNNNITLEKGDVVELKDDQLGIDRQIRVIQVSYPLVNVHKIEGIIADEIPYLARQLANKQLSKVVKNYTNIVNTTVNKVTNVTEVSTRPTETTSNSQTTSIDGKVFRYIKDFDNYQQTILEPNDILIDGYWDRFTLVKKWKYIGGNILERTSFEEIETLLKPQV